MERSFRSRSLRQSVDWSLVILYLILTFIGLVNIYASIYSDNPASIFDLSCRSGKQFLWMMVSFSLAALILFAIPARLWENLSIPGYVIVLILLVAVIFLGREVKGSHSWFSFGPIRFQPAEISKISTSLLLAFVMSREGFKISKIKDFTKVALIIVIPMLVILAEKEAGSALVYIGFMFMLYREGLSGWFIVAFGLGILLFVLTLTTSPFISLLVLMTCISIFNILNGSKLWKGILSHLAFLLPLSFLPLIWKQIQPESAFSFLLQIDPIYILIGTGVIAIPFFLYEAFQKNAHYLYISVLGFIVGIAMIFSTDFLFNNILQPHQRGRIEVLLGMKEDPSGVGYNVNQSMIAIGSGGLTGKGFLHGTQTAYGFVPEQSTDFISCTIGEEWGFIGSAGTILIYVFLMLRIIYDAEKSREKFTRIYGYCITCCIFMHVFINIGMTIGIMPVIGIPLPLISYGGSSIVTFTILLFIFIALDRQEKKYF